MSRSLVVGALWLLALLYWATDSPAVSTSIAQDGVFAKWDMPLHARGETQTTFKSATTRVSTEPQVDTPPKTWLSIIGVDITPDIIVKFPCLASHRQHIYLQKLQSLDSPRAPPFV